MNNGAENNKGEGGLRSPNRKPRHRLQHRRELRAAGEYVTPTRRQFVWHITTGTLAIPDWARDAAVKGLAVNPKSVWLWWTDARMLIGLDRQAGGGTFAQRVELRFCPHCDRPYVGTEADRRRRLGIGTECGASCRVDSKTGVWRKLRAVKSVTY